MLELCQPTTVIVSTVDCDCMPLSNEDFRTLNLSEEKNKVIQLSYYSKSRQSQQQNYFKIKFCESTPFMRFFCANTSDPFESTTKELRELDLKGAIFQRDGTATEGAKIENDIKLDFKKYSSQYSFILDLFVSARTNKLSESHNNDEVKKVINFENCFSLTPLQLISTNKGVTKETISQLLDLGASASNFNKHGRSAFTYACQHFSFDLIKQFIDGGAIVNPTPTDITGNVTPLMGAICNEKSLEVMELLVDKGADVNNDHCDYKRTALIFAAINGKFAELKWLLEKGADVDAVDSEGNSAIFHAIIHQHVEIINILCQHGAAIDFKNIYKQEPFSFFGTIFRTSLTSTSTLPSLVDFFMSALKDDYWSIAVVLLGHKLDLITQADSITSLFQDDKRTKFKALKAAVDGTAKSTPNMKTALYYALKAQDTHAAGIIMTNDHSQLSLLMGNSLCMKELNEIPLAKAFLDDLNEMVLDT